MQKPQAESNHNGVTTINEKKTLLNNHPNDLTGVPLESCLRKTAICTLTIFSGLTYTYLSPGPLQP